MNFIYCVIASDFRIKLRLLCNTDACNPSTQSFVGEVYLKILPDITNFKIHWKVTARQLMQPCEGDLNISVMPEYEYECRTSATETGEEIEDLLEDITD